jgi:hypothetical protein
MRARVGIDPSANMNRNHKSSRQLRVAASAAIYGNSLFLATATLSFWLKSIAIAARQNQR